MTKTREELFREDAVKLLAACEKVPSLREYIDIPALMAYLDGEEK